MRQSYNPVTLHTVQIFLPAIPPLLVPPKKALRGKRFTSDDDVKQYVRNWFTTQPREFYYPATHRLVSQWDKCLNNQFLFLGLRLVSFLMFLM